LFWQETAQKRLEKAQKRLILVIVWRGLNKQFFGSQNNKTADLV
jgi:hypothetical protein